MIITIKRKNASKNNNSNDMKKKKKAINEKFDCNEIIPLNRITML